ncbi:Hint domain-containing protein [Natronohydrobacter thiooxidans]|uniref:Hint domain-containing protein n=1 Tax=Natronohydrobacter thiooxidans TaxID=87172 RepID=UPI0008FF0534|nr:Hint domain-containing protein [Natronohydrobacter thiooxidans]
MYATTISLAPPLARAKPRARTSALPGFAAGTLLRTITGPRAVERIMAGDLLLDAEGQIIELRSLRCRRASARELVEITPAALGLGLAPALRQKSLVVGAGQKLGMRDWRTDLIYGAPALTEAQALIDSATVQRPTEGAMLYRLGFDRDIVVVANGMPALVRASDA